MKPNSTERAFTLVEVLVVVVILIIITVIGTLSYGKFQGDSRDNTRKAKATILAEALEQYYQKNGEYPSVAAMTSSNPTVLKTKLSISDSDVLIMPGASSNVTNSITPDEPDTDKIAYNGESENSSEAQQCQTNHDGGCDRFKLEWKNENNELVEIKSRQSDRDSNQTLSAPATPSLSVTTVAGPALRGTASSSVCSAGTLNYKLAVNTTGQSPNWSSIAWTTGSTVQQSSPVPGTTYHFYAIAGCRAGSSGEAVSGQAKRSQLYASTDAPTVALATNSTNLTATATSATICPAGTTVKYLLQYDIDTTSTNGSWVTGQNWTTSNAYTTPTYTNTPPRAFNYRAQIRCDDNATGVQSTPSPTSQVATLITAPSAPVVSLASSTDKDTKTWQWAAVSCPVGTSAEYISTYSRDDSTGWRAYPSDDNATTDTMYSLATNYQGYAYGVKTKARCTLGETFSPWSTEAIGASYIRVVDAPAAPSGFVIGRGSYTSLNGSTAYGVSVYWPMPTCGLGTSRLFQRANWGYYKYKSDNTNYGDSSTTPGSGAPLFTGSTNTADDFTRWASTSTTTSNLTNYFRLASSVPAADVPNQFNNYTPTASNPIWTVGTTSTSIYVSAFRIYARHACYNTQTARYAIGAPTLATKKTWTGP